MAREPLTLLADPRIYSNIATQIPFLHTYPLPCTTQDNSTVTYFATVEVRGISEAQSQYTQRR